MDGAEVCNDAANSLKRAYNRAKANAPSVLFIDSVDALAPARCPLNLEVPHKVDHNEKAFVSLSAD